MPNSYIDVEEIGTSMPRNLTFKSIFAAIPPNLTKFLVKQLQILGGLALVLSTLIIGFATFTYRTTERSASERTMMNMSQLPVGNIGFIYLEEWKSYQTEILIDRTREMLRSNRIDHLFIVAPEESIDKANAIGHKFSIYTDRISIDIDPDNSILASMLQVCKAHNGCTITVVGPKETVAKGLFAAQLIGREAVGYSVNNISTATNTYQETRARMMIYLESQSFNPAGTARHLLLTQQANQ